MRAHSVPVEGQTAFPFESLNLRLIDPERMSRSPAQDSLGIDSVCFFSRLCVSAWRVTFELQTGKTLARFPADCSQKWRADFESPLGAPPRSVCGEL